MLICDEYLTPASLDEAFAAMEARRGRYRLVAGATDSFPWAREGRAGDVTIPTLIDISRIAELTERRIDDRRVRLGAATPMQRFLDDPALVRAMPCMPRCAVWFADDQIRAQARIGGNCVNAAPLPSVASPCVPRGPGASPDDHPRAQEGLGANLVNASPSADGTPPLLA